MTTPNTALPRGTLRGVPELHRDNAPDRAIDKLVYELYGLTEDEIRIVEGNE